MWFCNTGRFFHSREGSRGSVGDKNDLVKWRFFLHMRSYYTLGYLMKPGCFTFGKSLLYYLFILPEKVKILICICCLLGWVSEATQSESDPKCFFILSLVNS